MIIKIKNKIILINNNNNNNINNILKIYKKLKLKGNRASEPRILCDSPL